jgi:two-component system, chemotaxis family, response regulator Rcp1
MRRPPARKLHVLLVDDSESDADLVREVLADGGLDLQLSVMRDGAEALEFLRRAGRHAQAGRPDLILLDLNLPGEHGLEILEKIQDAPDLRPIPVVVLSVSVAPRDVSSSYDLGANCYVVKPLEVEEFRRIMQQLAGFWFDIVRLPPALHDP